MSMARSISGFDLLPGRSTPEMNHRSAAPGGNRIAIGRESRVIKELGGWEGRQFFEGVGVPNLDRLSPGAAGRYAKPVG